MIEEIEKSPAALAVNTDLRMLPDTRIWYRAKQGTYLQGNVIGLRFDQNSRTVRATLVLSSPLMGPGVWRYDDKVYAPHSQNLDETWYFHNPTEETQTIMHNLGYEMSEDELQPMWSKLKRLREPLSEEAKELVEKVMSKANGKHDGEADTAGSKPADSNAGKHNKAHAS